MEQVTQRREADPSEYVKAGLIRFVTGFYASPPASGSALPPRANICKLTALNWYPNSLPYEVAQQCDCRTNKID